MRRDLPNILLVTIDSLRFERLGCYGYRRDTSPHIDKLASGGALFSEAISNAGSTPTAFPCMLASALPPLSESECRVIMRRHTSLAELLRGAGYRTAAFHANPYLSRFYYYDKGFEVFEDNMGRASVWALGARVARTRLSSLLNKPPFSFLVKVYRWLLLLSFGFGNRATTSDLLISKQAKSWLDSHRGSFFLWLHYMGVHAPYMPPQKYARQFHQRRLRGYQMYRLFQKMVTTPDKLSPAEIAELKDLYDADIKYVDDLLDGVLAKIGSRLKNTIVILTADHGEGFGEHGHFFHGTLYDEVIRVPLIIKGPGVKAGTVVKQQVSLIDLVPTVLDLAGVGKAATFQGKSLLPLLKGRSGKTEAVVSAIPPRGGQQYFITCRTPKWKYIRTESTVPPHKVVAEELYNLSDDPGETTNLSKSPKREARRFRQAAIKHISQYKQARLREATMRESERIRQRIKKLARR